MLFYYYDLLFRQNSIFFQFVSGSELEYWSHIYIAIQAVHNNVDITLQVSHLKSLYSHHLSSNPFAPVVVFEMLHSHEIHLLRDLLRDQLNPEFQYLNSVNEVWLINNGFRSVCCPREMAITSHDVLNILIWDVDIS